MRNLIEVAILVLTEPWLAVFTLAIAVIVSGLLIGATGSERAANVLISSGCGLAAIAVFQLRRKYKRQ